MSLQQQSQVTPEQHKAFRLKCSLILDQMQGVVDMVGADQAINSQRYLDLCSELITESNRFNAVLFANQPIKWAVAS